MNSADDQQRTPVSGLQSLPSVPTIHQLSSVFAEPYYAPSSSPIVEPPPAAPVVSAQRDDASLSTDRSVSALQRRWILFNRGASVMHHKRPCESLSIHHLRSLSIQQHVVTRTPRPSCTASRPIMRSTELRLIPAPLFSGELIHLTPRSLKLRSLPRQMEQNYISCTHLL